MKKFFLVIEDLLDSSNKDVVGLFEAESKELLIEHFGLIERENSEGINKSYSSRIFGDVAIYIVENKNYQVDNSKDLSELCCDLYSSWSTMITTKGNQYGVECPHCGKINNYVADGVQVKINEARLFEKECLYCNKNVYYSAMYQMLVDAFDQNPTKEPKTT